MHDEKRLRELLGYFARQYVVDCHALMDMDAAETARSMAHDLTPEEMRAMADLLTETDAETALAELCALVAGALRTLADKAELAHKRTRKRRRKGVKAQC
ncbi:MAG: hypothetical protein IJQ81_05465 [Oscillibacter sp.]|nr:hypothetical protein [Oscillibacter sp.]